MRRIVVFPILTLPVLTLLAGCAIDVQRLHDLSPTATDFPSALASEYQAYADSEMEQGRSAAAEHYASKGLKALGGKTVAPDEPDETLPAVAQQELAEARSQLINTLSDEVKRVAPEQAARSQLLFDCWQHELTKHLDQAQAPCADEFHSTFAQLRDHADALVYHHAVHYTVTFASHTTELDEANLATIHDVAQQIADGDTYKVRLDAYIGRSSSEHHLVNARLAAVRKALIQAGVREHSIRSHKRGGAKAVLLSNDNITTDTKKITITIKTLDKTGTSTGKKRS